MEVSDARRYSAGEVADAQRYPAGEVSDGRRGIPREVSRGGRYGIRRARVSRGAYAKGGGGGQEDR